jgi:3-deoxy-manno-octulosonate cytidylyltransferase (CMP-KDO synthetase)
LIVIPARYGSTRLPGKPLLKLNGRTLLERVVRIAEQAGAAANAAHVVATDNEEILSHCREIGVRAVMTSPDLASGTDRALAAIEASGMSGDFVLNLQGDAPFTPPEHVAALIDAAQGQEGDVFTPVIRLSWEALDALRAHKKTAPFSGTTCLRAEDGRAYWFSKAIVPAIRGEEKLRGADGLSPVYRHIGLYGYRLAALERFAALPQGHYEKLEGLEQLRFLENGMSVRAVEVAPPHLSMSGIDTPADLELAEKLIARLGDPFEMPAAAS